MKTKQCILGLIATFVISFGVYSQQVMFSSEPFEIGKEQNNSLKTEFKPGEKIYGLVVWNQPLQSLFPDADSAMTASNEVYHYARYTYQCNAGLMNYAWSDMYVIGKGDKSYGFLHILPEPEHAYYFLDLSDAMSQLLKPESGFGSKLTLRFKNDNKPLNFNAKIKVGKDKSLNDSQLRDLATKCRESQPTLQDDIERKREYDKTQRALPGNFLSNKLVFTDSELTDEALTKHLQSKYPDAEVLYLTRNIWNQAAYKDKNWIIFKDNYGQPSYMTTPIINAVFQGDEGCYYTTFTIVKDHLGGGNYGEPYFTSEGPNKGKNIFNCAKLPEQ